MDIAIYFILFAILLALVLIIPKKRRTRRFGVVLLVVALLCEVFVFNFHSFHLVGGDYNAVTYGAESEGLKLSDVTESALTAELSGIDQPVGSVLIKCAMDENAEAGFKGTPYINVKLDAKDETQQGYYRSSVAEGQIIRGNGRSAYVVVNLSGDVSDLRIRLSAKNGCAFELESISLNEAIPMHFSWLRLLLIVGLAMAIYALVAFPSLVASYEDERLRCRVIAMVMTAVLIACAGAMTALYQYDRTGGMISKFEQTSGNQITQELVDAFEAGQVELLDKPSDELLALNNPYDWSERSNAQISYKWDHLLFEGKYYSYYGIAPVLLLFLPYHMMTGYYFPTPEAVFLFGALGILFLSLAYLSFCDRFCKRIPLNMLLSGLLICQICSGVWYNFCSPLFYEIAQTSGFCFTCAGFWLLLRSGVIGEGKIKLPSVCLSSVCFSLAVLCRPTLVLYCFAALIFLFFGLRKRLHATKELEVKLRRRSVISYLVASLVPFVVIGSVQMLYNYARFGSFFDFGIQYSLTINDFTRAEYHTDLAMIGFHNFLFAFPYVRPEFPYVFTNFSDLAVNGYYFIANRYGVGLLIQALPTLAYFAAVPAYKALHKEERPAAVSLIAATCVLIPLGIIFSIWESGYGVRYCTDFAWQFILGAIGILFLLYARRAEKQTERLMQYFFIVSVLVAFVCNFGMIYTYMSKTGFMETAFLNFERLFDFWM